MLSARWLRCVAVFVAVVVLAAGCGGEPEPQGELEAETQPEPAVVPEAEEAPEPSASRDVSEPEAVSSVGGRGLFGGSQVGDFDLERLLAAARTLDRGAVCPDAVFPESLDGVAEVLRIEGGCAILEYVPLGGRSLGEVREEVFASDPSAHAVGLPPRDLRPAQASPPSPFDRDGFSGSDWQYLRQMDARWLWEPDGWGYNEVVDTDGDRRFTASVPGWPDGEEVVVAVIDTGVDEHRDLAGQLIGAPGGSWLDESCHNDDQQGHGTHVAGLVAARQGNGRDTAGLAPNAKILAVNLLGSFEKQQGVPVRITDPCPADASDIDTDKGETTGRVSATQAVRLAVEAGADIVNMSFWWGTPTDIWEQDSQGSDAFEAMIMAMVEVHGTWFVTAAGNCGDPNNLGDCPDGQDMAMNPVRYRGEGEIRGVIAVGAVDQHNQRAVFSTQNRDVSFAAPGDGSSAYDGILSTVPGGTDYKSGTSMAAPLFSAMLAHMIARYPDATDDQILEAILTTAHNPDAPDNTFPDPDAGTDAYGWGIVKPKAALEKLDQLLIDRPTTIPDVGGGEGGVTIAAGASARGHPDCTSEHCRHLEIALTNAPDGPYTVNCHTSNNPNQPWRTATWHWPTAPQWTQGGCIYNTPGHQIWAIVTNQHGTNQSNTITWPTTTTTPPPPEPPPQPPPEPPDSAPAVGDATFSAVSAGASHSCGLRSDGTITCWGDGSSGQLSAPGGRFTAITSASTHSCAVGTNGAITCWGANDYGSLDAPSGRFVAIDSGGITSCAVRADGTVACWGDNYYGQTEAPGGAFSAVSAGGRHSCGLRSDGTITCWGDNNDGQTEAPGGAFSAVSAGASHSCGLRSDGTITCWGDNNFGQTEVPGGAFSAVSAGGRHSCGLRSDGTITCWGDNTYGQTEVPGGAFSAVSAGGRHSCGLRSDGTITCWGDNTYGQTEVPGVEPTTPVGGSVVLSRGRNAQGVDPDCSSANCHFLRVDLVGFDLSAGPFAVRCWHYAVPSAGWEHAEWENYSTAQAVSEYCIWGVADHDVYVIVEDPRTGETVRSNDARWP